MNLPVDCTANKWVNQMIKKKFINKSRKSRKNKWRNWRIEEPRKPWRYGEKSKESHRSHTDLRKIQFDRSHHYEYNTHNTHSTDIDTFYQYYEPGYDNWMNPWMKKKKPRRHRTAKPSVDKTEEKQFEVSPKLLVSDISESFNISDDEASGKSTPSTVGSVSPELDIEDMTNPIDDDKEEKYVAPPSSEYVVDYDHVKIAVSELSEHIEVTDEHSGTKLMDIFAKIEVNSTHLSMWELWSGGSFSNKDAARSKLQTVIDYAEKTPSAPLIKTQLRVLTKLIMEKGLKNSEEYVHVLLLLASHGGVCNVMKDVAINNAYGMMTETLFDVIKLQTLDQQMLKELRNYRHILVERLHLVFKFNTNQHTVNGFYNQIADSVGLTKYIDPNLGNPYGTNADIYKKNLDKRFFATMYTKENIIERMYGMIEEKKISYQKIVQFLIDHKPENVDKSIFLQQAIDIDNGKIGEEYMCFLLQKLKVLMIKPEDWKPIEKCWDDVK